MSDGHCCGRTVAHLLWPITQCATNGLPRLHPCLRPHPPHTTEINSLRASAVQLAAQLNISQSLVAHLNDGMKRAIEKADDGDALSTELVRQLDTTQRELSAISQEKVRRSAGRRGARAGVRGGSDLPRPRCTPAAAQHAHPAPPPSPPRARSLS